MKKRLSILGSTGSIGANALKIVRHLKEEFEVVALAANSNIDLLEAQAKEFRPQVIGVFNKEKALELKKRLPGFHVVGGEEGVLEAAVCGTAHFVLSGISGFAGIKPTLAAIEKGKQIGLASKEVLVAAGNLVIDLAKEKGADLIPIDSEQSGIFQCLKGEKSKEVHRLILTASGGPFFHSSIEDLSNATVDKALYQLNYRMGTKIAIDSSTLMNKGLRMIESHFLFGIPTEKIEVVVHPQQIIHSFVEFIDGSIMAQLSEPSILFAIQFALTYPERKKSPLPHFDFTKHAFHFFKVDKEKFRCLELAYEAIKEGGSLPCYMSAANDMLVERFLRREIGWLEISRKLENLMQRHQVQKKLNIESLYSIHSEARKEALTV